MPEDRAIEASNINSKSAWFPSHPNRPVRKLVKNWLWDLKGLVRNVRRLIGYICVCDGGGGEKHFSRDILNCFLKDYNIFPLIQAVKLFNIKW